jgi:tetratricopeptide (TPR) repeat protein
MPQEFAVPSDTQQRLDKLALYLAADPDNLALLAEAIDVALTAGALPAASRYLARALALAPHDPFIVARQGHLLLGEHCWEEAAELFAGLLSAKADAILAYNAAYARFQLGQYEQASMMLLPFADQCDPVAMILLLRALHRSHQLELAIDLISRQEARLGGDSGFLAAASLVHVDGGDMRLAQRLSERALAAGTRPLEAVVSGATFYLSEGDAGQARAMFDEAVAINPRDGRSWFGLGVASLLAGDFTRGAEQLTRALEFIPEHIGSWHALGWCQLFAGHIELAEAAFRQALALDRNFGDTHGALAVVAALKHEPQTAQASVDRALGLDPDGLAARYAQMILGGQTADPARFRAVALRLLAARQSPTGRSLKQMVQEHAAR